MKQVDVAKVLGMRIRELRASRHLTQEQLAAGAQLHVTYLSSLEGGNRNPSLRTCYSIATALQISLAELFEGM